MELVFGLVALGCLVRFALLRSPDQDAATVRFQLMRLRIQPPNELLDGSRGTTTGMAVAVGPTTRAPVTGRECIYWQLRFDEVGAGDYVELTRIHHGGELLLVSPAGTARVVLDQPQVDLRPYERLLPGDLVRGEDWDSHPVLVHAKRRGRRLRLNHRGSVLRVCELIIEPAAMLVVSGWCAREPDPTATEDVVGYRDQLPTRPVLSGSRRTPLLIGAGPPVGLRDVSPAAG